MPHPSRSDTSSLGEDCRQVIEGVCILHKQNQYRFVQLSTRLRRCRVWSCKSSLARASAAFGETIQTQDLNFRSVSPRKLGFTLLVQNQVRSSVTGNQNQFLGISEMGEATLTGFVHLPFKRGGFFWVSFLRASTKSVTIWQVCSSYSQQGLNEISTASYLHGLGSLFTLQFVAFKFVPYVHIRWISNSLLTRIQIQFWMGVALGLPFFKLFLKIHS